MSADRLFASVWEWHSVEDGVLYTRTSKVTEGVSRHSQGMHRFAALTVWVLSGGRSQYRAIGD
jgi:hypothetical protein